MNKKHSDKQQALQQGAWNEASSSSGQICACGSLLKSLLKEAKSTYPDDRCGCHEAGIAALNVMAEIVIASRLRSSDMVYVGQIIHNQIRTKAYILGPMRVDGGIVLLTQMIEIKRRKTRSSAYFLDDLYGELELKRRCGRLSELCGLIEKAIDKRDRILRGTTNYFSGGKVVEIL